MHRSSRRTLLAAAVLATALASHASAQPATKAPVSVVLVHGAFENSSVWGKVIPILQRRGITVVTAQNPLTSVSADA